MSNTSGQFAQALAPPVQVELDVSNRVLLSPRWINVLQSYYQILSARSFPVETEVANGAINIKDGTSLIIASAPLAMTIPAPIKGPLTGTTGTPPNLNGDDMKTLLIFSNTANAHTVTAPANVFNGSLHIATWGAAIGNYIRFLAYNGFWYALDSKGVTLS